VPFYVTQQSLSQGGKFGTKLLLAYSLPPYETVIIVLRAMKNKKDTKEAEEEAKHS